MRAGRAARYLENGMFVLKKHHRQIVTECQEEAQELRDRVQFKSRQLADLHKALDNANAELIELRAKVTEQAVDVEARKTNDILVVGRAGAQNLYVNGRKLPYVFSVIAVAEPNNVRKVTLELEADVRFVHSLKPVTR